MDIQKISKAIQQNNLPGLDAHLEMTPYRRVIDPPNDKNVRKGAVLIVLYKNDNYLCFPLILRQSYNGVHSNQIAFPGGKYDSTDKDLLHTSLRECEEEIGIRVNEDKIIGQLTPIYIPPSNFYVEPYIAYLHEPPQDFILQADEVKELYQINLAELLNENNFISTKVKTQNTLLNTPAFKINNQIIWGATAAILNEVKHILKFH